MNSKLLFPAIILFSFTIKAQKINFEFDYAQFGYDSAANFIEFYYSFNQSSLTTANTDSGLYTHATLTISIKDSATGEIFLDRNWSVTNPVLDPSNLERSLIGMLSFVLLEGTYKCKITGADALKEGIEKSISEIIKVKPLLDGNMNISDVQLASNIIQASQNKESIFYKNTYEIIPNPSVVYGEGQPVLFYYSELYNIEQLSSDEGLRLDQFLFNSRGQLVNSKRKDLNRTASSRVEVGRVMANELSTDTYTLILNLIDSVANTGVSSSKRFFVYNPSIVYVDTFQQRVSSVLSTEFGAMSEEELDDLYDKCKYIAKTPENEQYDALSTVEGKREFLYNFWKARDDNPSDDLNQTYTFYLRRLEECNLRFKALGKEGWKTDRGRVFLVYGEPSEIERFPSQIDSKPYEIWNYHEIEGGVFFVFADLLGFSDYQLVHSNKRGELRDDTWLRRISVH